MAEVILDDPVEGNPFAAQAGAPGKPTLGALGGPALGAPGEPTLGAPGEPTLGEPVEGNPFASLGPPAAIKGQPAGFYDRLVASMQGGSPEIANKLQLAPASEQWLLREQDAVSDPAKYIALRDPQTGHYAAYHRNPDLERSSSALGEVAGRISDVSQIAPYMLPAGAPLVVGAMRPPTASQSLLRDYETLGVPPTAPAVGQSAAAGLTSQALRVAPIVGPVVSRASEQALAGTAGAAERIAGELGPATWEDVSSIVQGSEKRPEGGIWGFRKSETRPEGMAPAEIIAAPTRASSFEAKSDALYKRAASLIPQDTQIDLPNSLAALKGPMDKFPSSPELGKMLTDPKFAGYAQALEDSGGTLTVPEASALRSYVGKRIGDPSLMSDIPRSELKQVYGALTKDLQANAAAHGPEALSAFRRASQYYTAGIGRLDQLDTLIGKTEGGSFAAVNNAAGTGAAASPSFLNSLKRSLDPEDWKNVGAAMIRRMGNPTPGAKNELAPTPDFSPTAFANNWKKLSDPAKDILFGDKSPGSNRDALEALVRVSQSQQNVGKLANVTHSGEVAAGSLAAVKLFEHPELLSRPGLMAGTVAGIVGARQAAKLLMAPGFARWLYGLPAVARGVQPGEATQRALGGLDWFERSLSRDNELAPAITQIRSALSP